ncbi:PucR family transcriptional regulator [Embleya sp. AB8]|uniref:PucR family transcriptional regulator n=1 Tax=Embleya sp. AB8 TaxID=3156304 RepID=UPI003C784369
MGRAAIPDDFLDTYTGMLAEVSTTGRLLRRSELDALREQGEHAAEAGHAWRELITLYLDRTRRRWTTLPGIAHAPNSTEAARTGESVLRAVETAVDALAAGHERAQHLAIRQEEAARREFVDDLLYGRSDLGRLAERAERFGLRLAHAHAVAVAEGNETYTDIHPLVRRVERELVGRFGERDVLLTTKDGRLVCVAASTEGVALDAFAKYVTHPGTGHIGARRVAFGRAHSGAGGVVRSYEEALSALDLATRLDLPGPVLHAADLLVFPVLMRDRAAMADLVRAVLGPLTAARGGAGPLLETLTVLAEAGYIGAETARRLTISPRTLSYRLERIRILTGYDPNDAMQRFTLETAAMGARLLGWPAADL